MKKSNLSLKKSVCSFLVLAFLSSGCFSETYYKISESKLNEIQEQTKILQTSIETLQTQYQTLEKQRNQYQTLSQELKKEADTQKKRADLYRNMLIGAGCGAIAAGLACYFLR